MALLLSLRHIRVSFGMQDVLNMESFDLREGERIGLVGENGAGKTTLLSVIAGELEPDEGRVERKSDVSYIHQLEGGEDAADDPALLKQLRVDALDPLSAGLSGGERTRLRIAAALGRSAPILLCDEPTCNLDLNGIEWLQARLAAHTGGLIIVSHDRALLNAVCTSIALLEGGTLRLFPGDYDAYAAERARERDFQQFEYEQYKKEKARLAQAVRATEARSDKMRKTPTRMGNSEARLHRRSSTEIQEKLNKTAHAIESRLEHLERKDRPRDEPDIRMALPPVTSIVSRVAASVEGYNAVFGGRVILNGATFELPAGGRTVMMGPNGAGKTTLARALINGADGARIAAGIKLGVFTQGLDTLDDRKTVLENLQSSSDRPEWALRTVLARLNIRGDAVHKRVSVLSGGERAKAQMALLFVSDANLLILDEPTNYLDLYTMEALETLLAAYEGTALIITHDRHLADAVATRLLWVQDGGVRAFAGNYTQYLASLKPKPDTMDRTRLEMRLAVIGARLAAQIPAEEREALSREYGEVAASLHEYKA